MTLCQVPVWVVSLIAGHTWLSVAKCSKAFTASLIYTDVDPGTIYIENIIIELPYLPEALS